MIETGYHLSQRQTAEIKERDRRRTREDMWEGSNTITPKHTILQLPASCPEISLTKAFRVLHHWPEEPRLHSWSDELERLFYPIVSLVMILDRILSDSPESDVDVCIKARPKPIDFTDSFVCKSMLYFTCDSHSHTKIIIM